jgi:hypothetical protein
MILGFRPAYITRFAPDDDYDNGLGESVYGYALARFNDDGSLGALDWRKIDRPKTDYVYRGIQAVAVVGVVVITAGAALEAYGSAGAAGAGTVGVETVAPALVSDAVVVESGAGFAALDTAVVSTPELVGAVQGATVIGGTGQASAVLSAGSVTSVLSTTAQALGAVVSIDRSLQALSASGSSNNVPRSALGNSPTRGQLSPIQTLSGNPVTRRPAQSVGAVKSLEPSRLGLAALGLLGLIVLINR